MRGSPQFILGGQPHKKLSLKNPPTLKEPLQHGTPELRHRFHPGLVPNIHAGSTELGHHQMELQLAADDQPGRQAGCPLVGGPAHSGVGSAGVESVRFVVEGARLAQVKGAGSRLQLDGYAVVEDTPPLGLWAGRGRPTSPPWRTPTGDDGCRRSAPDGLCPVAPLPTSFRRWYPGRPPACDLLPALRGSPALRTR